MSKSKTVLSGSFLSEKEERRIAAERLALGSRKRDLSVRADELTTQISALDARRELLEAEVDKLSEAMAFMWPDFGGAK